MKRKYIYIVGCLLSFIGMIGCEDMDDNYKQYLEDYNYSGKVTSVRSYLGFERVALAWDNPKDQKSKHILIEYGVDKQQKIFDYLVDSVVIDGLDTGTGFDFAIYTLDNAGNRSVPATITALPISQTMVDNLVPPTCSYVKVDGVPSVYWAGLSAVSMAYCKYSYIDYKIVSEDGDKVITEGCLENENVTSLDRVNELTLPAPELSKGSTYYVNFTAYVYPVSSDIVTMDSVPVNGRTRIIIE